MLLSCQTVWGNCLHTIRNLINNERSFNTWFLPIKPVALENTILTIQVPSSYFYEYLEETFVAEIHTALRKELGTEAQLMYQVVIDRDNKQSLNMMTKGVVSPPNFNKNQPQQNPGGH